MRCFNNLICNIHINYFNSCNSLLIIFQDYFFQEALERPWKPAQKNQKNYSGNPKILYALENLRKKCSRKSWKMPQKILNMPCPENPGYSETLNLFFFLQSLNHVSWDVQAWVFAQTSTTGEDLEILLCYISMLQQQVRTWMLYCATLVCFNNRWGPGCCIVLP